MFLFFGLRFLLLLRDQSVLQSCYHSFFLPVKLPDISFILPIVAGRMFICVNKLFTAAQTDKVPAAIDTKKLTITEPLLKLVTVNEQSENPWQK